MVAALDWSVYDMNEWMNDTETDTAQGPGLHLIPSSISPMQFNKYKA